MLKEGLSIDTIFNLLYISFRRTVPFNAAIRTISPVFEVFLQIAETPTHSRQLVSLFKKSARKDNRSAYKWASDWSKYWQEISEKQYVSTTRHVFFLSDFNLEQLNNLKPLEVPVPTSIYPTMPKKYSIKVAWLLL
jgi:hypothetical protein